MHELIPSIRESLMHHSVSQPFSRGLRRQRHLRQPTDNLTCGYQPHSTNPLAHSLVARCNQLRYCLRLRSRYTRADPIAGASSQHSVVKSLPIHRQLRLGVKQFRSTDTKRFQFDEFLPKWSCVTVPMFEHDFSARCQATSNKQQAASTKNQEPRTKN